MLVVEFTLIKSRLMPEMFFKIDSRQFPAYGHVLPEIELNFCKSKILKINLSARNKPVKSKHRLNCNH